jgi:precorrin-4 C11-methyltransferase
LASIKAIGSIALKSDEKAFIQLAATLLVPFECFSAAELNSITNVPNPSATVMQKIGVKSVAEAASALLAGKASWMVPKQKCDIHAVADGEPRYFTFAISIAASVLRQGRIAIVGAGPGDPELITRRGHHYLETADLILYSGSLVPEKLTHAAKAGATVRNSASLSLEEQLELMHAFYRAGKFVVRLHTGDPSIYGAIQEQMVSFEEHEMMYEIVPGVSSFQAAAAALHSEFTIPERVQSIILTRGEGRTSVPEKERLSELARSRSTMCIYLSADIAQKVQSELLEHYPPETPVAICYRLTWDDEQIWRGELAHLAELVAQSGKTKTVLLVVGEAIGARMNRSKLYDPTFAHGFRAATNVEGKTL